MTLSTLLLLAATVLEFPVENGEMYHVRLEAEGTRNGASAGNVVRLGFQDANGKDIEATEKALGYPVSARSVTLERAGEVVLEARAGGKTGTRAAKAVVTLPDDSTFKVKSAKWFVGEYAVGKDEVSSGIDTSMKGEGNFAPNLLANPSFEEVQGNLPLHWQYSGPGKGRLVRESYAGNYAVKLTAEESGGRWQSDPFKVEPEGFLEVLFAIRYSQHARPLAHINPVNIEFLDAAGRVVQHAFRWALDHRYYTADRFANWGIMTVNPYVVPKGAVQARVFIEHRDLEPIGGGLTMKVGWGDIFVDNIVVWQSYKETPVAFPISSLRGASMLLADKKPPQLPVGKKREGSVWSVQPIVKDFNFFFANETKAPTIELAVGNFMGYERKLTLKGELKSSSGEVLGPVTVETTLAPYELKMCSVPVKAPNAYGLYQLSYEFFEGDARAGHGSITFVWLARRPVISTEERRSVDYPFDIHPTDRLGFPAREGADAEGEAEVRLAALLGAGGIRQQFWGENISADPEKSVENARKDVANWREKTLPYLKKYGIRSWISYMEQHTYYIPRKANESAGWKAYWREFGNVISNDIEFILFGNEGIGGYASGYGLDDDLTQQTCFRGTIRQWANAYRWMRDALHETNPTLDVGFAMAGDVSGKFTRQFYGEFPAIPREVYGINGYVRPPEMLVNCQQAMGAKAASSAYSVLPELGYVANIQDWDARLEGTAEGVAISYLDVKAVSPRTRRCAWFIMRTGDNDGHGVMSITWQPRPAAAAYAVMTDTLGAGRVVRSETLSDGGRFHIWERLDGRRIGLGISPKGMSIALTAKGALQKMDIYGNKTPLSAAGTNIIVKLSNKPFYVLGEGLDVFERFTVDSPSPIDSGADRATVQIRIKNRTQETLSLEADVNWLAALSVDKSREGVVLSPGEEKTLAYNVRFVGVDGSRPYRFLVSVREPSSGLSKDFAADLRFASRKANNLLKNGDFNKVDVKGALVGWTPSVTYSPGRPTPEVFITRKENGSPSGGSCASIALGLPHTADAVIRLSQRVTLKPATRYYWSTREKSLKGLYSWPHVAAYVRNAQGRVISSPPFDAVNSGGEWINFEGGFVSPNEPCELEYVLLITNASRGEALYADAMLIEVKE